MESCPSETNSDVLWACTDDDASYTASEGYQCGDSSENFNLCLSKADVNMTKQGASQDSLVVGGKGTCMFPIESVECESLLAVT